MGVSDSVTTSFPPPVIHDSHVFSLPCFMLNPIIRFYTINYIPLLYYPFSPFSPPPRLIHRVGRSSDITLRCVLQPPTPPSKPRFQEPNPPEGLQNSYAIRRSRCIPEWEMEIAMLHSAQITLWTWKSEINHNTDRNFDKNKGVFCVCSAFQMLLSH